jgi:hypothetical protein
MLEENETKSSEQPAIGSCFFGHKWSMWKQYNATMLSLKDMKTKYQQLRQKRFCLRCNKMQAEDIDF